MAYAASILMLFGSIAATAGAVGCVIAVYRQNEDLALGALLLDVILLIGIFMYWRDTRKPFSIMLAGGLLVAAGWALGGSFEGLS